MATIYDVAKLAGVSIGTVSNYLNHKYVGTTRSRAIQKAIEELNYTPNHIARSLKTNIISEILLILPNLSEGIYNELANTIIQEMHQRGYRIHLELSNNSAREEKKLLDTGFSATYSAVLLCTSNPNDEKTFQRLQSLKPLIFLLRRPNGMDDYSFLGFDNFGIVNRITTWLLESGEKYISLWTGSREFSCERDCINGFRHAFAAKDFSLPEHSIVTMPFSRGAVFRSATDLFASRKYPKFILASSKLIADAIIEAAYFQNIILNKDVCVLSLGDGKWSNVDQLYCNLSTNRSIRAFAMETCQYLCECMAAPSSYERRIRQIQDDFSISRLQNIQKMIYRPKTPARIRPSDKHLTIITHDSGDTGVLSIQSLISWISETIDIDIEMKLYPVYDLIPLVMKDFKEQKYSYDMIYLDNSWIQQIAELGIIRDITSYFENRPHLSKALIPNLLERTATIHNHIYGVPSLLCAQTLFYRKDLFEDPVLQNKFAELYHRQLTPPTNWFEYMLIANFFTRSKNPDSPVEYGVVMGTRDDEMMLTEVLPRIWAYGGNLFDNNGDVCLYSEESMQGIRNYISCLSCSTPDWENRLLPHFPVSFAEGNAAMSIFYDIHACKLIDYKSSKVLDKIGFAPIPGGTSTMGGWNYCINALSPKIDLCYKLMDCLLSDELAVPYSLLGGGSPLQNAVCSSEVLAIYPWMQHSNQIFQQSRHRSVPMSKSHINPTETEVERVLAHAIRQAILEPNRLSEFLLHAERTINSMRIPRN